VVFGSAVVVGAPAQMVRCGRLGAVFVPLRVVRRRAVRVVLSPLGTNRVGVWGCFRAVPSHPQKDPKIPPTHCIFRGGSFCPSPSQRVLAGCLSLFRGCHATGAPSSGGLLSTRISGFAVLWGGAPKTTTIKNAVFSFSAPLGASRCCSSLWGWPPTGGAGVSAHAPRLYSPPLLAAFSSGVLVWGAGCLF